jgi:hypothetical protein
MNRFTEGQKIRRTVLMADVAGYYTYAGPSLVGGYIVVRHYLPDATSIDFDEHPDVWEVDV